MSSRIQLRRSPAEDWASVNPVLSQGEAGYEIDTGLLKVGDGFTAWNSLSYFNPPPTNVSDLNNDSGFITSADIPEDLSAFNDDVGFLLASSPAGSILAADVTNWDTAYGWGDHATFGYATTANVSAGYQPLDGDLTTIAGLSDFGTGLLRKDAADTWSLDTSTYQTTDVELSEIITAAAGAAGLLRKTGGTWQLDTTVYLTSGDDAAGVTALQITNWDTAYGWGDHSLAGYLTSFTETDPIFTASPAGSILAGDVTNWDTAFSWGDHAIAGYLTSFTETDPVFTASPAAGILAGDITNWDNAFAWGDHSLVGYLVATDLNALSSVYQPLDGDLTSIAGLAGTTGNLIKTAANTWSLDTDSYARIVLPPPATPTSAGVAGDVSYNDQFFYFCRAANTWERVAVDGTWV